MADPKAEWTPSWSKWTWTHPTGWLVQLMNGGEWCVTTPQGDRVDWYAECDDAIKHANKRLQLHRELQRIRLLLREGGRYV